MTITELIEKLQSFKDELGDVKVEVRNPAGDFDEAEEIQIVNVSNKGGATFIWRVFIDA